MGSREEVLGMLKIPPELQDIGKILSCRRSMGDFVRVTAEGILIISKNGQIIFPVPRALKTKRD